MFILLKILEISKSLLYSEDFGFHDMIQEESTSVCTRWFFDYSEVKVPGSECVWERFQDLYLNINIKMF